MQQREKFASRLGFILISAGCAIGIGNVYRFPIITGVYGGAIFVAVYIAFLLLLGLPIMSAELSVGRASQRSIASSFDVLEKKGRKWHLWKYAGIAGNYLLMMFYLMIASWMGVYFVKYLDGSILPYQSVQELNTMFATEVTTPLVTIVATVTVTVLCFTVCALGLQKGVERITKVMMVALLFLMVGLAAYSCTLSGALEGLKFYLVPSVEHVKESGGIVGVISAAMGQAFFTLSLGIGSIAIFGSYIGKERRLLGEASVIISLDTLVALMSGLIIFPAYFTYNGAPLQDSDGGATFVFTTFSSIFNGMKGGRILGALFFLFMVFAALSTVIAVFENIISFWLELTKLKRWQIAVINILLFCVLTLPAIFSFSIWSDVTVFGKTFQGLEDFIVSNLLLPIGSLIYVLFCVSRYGWGWDNYLAEVNAGKGLAVPKWLRGYMTYVLPVIILVVLVMSLI